MTLYVYNFDDGNVLQDTISFNGNLYDANALTYRMVIKSRYTNKNLDFTTGSGTNWVVRLDLDTYNDRYTQFTISTPQQDGIADQFASGLYDYSIEWTDQPVGEGQDPNNYTWITVQDGLIKLKTSATEDLAFEGPEEQFFPTKHYEGPNPSAESYVIYKE